MDVKTQAMQLLDLTCDTPEENIALDEALLEQAEAAGRPAELLRLWEPRQMMVVVGRSSKVDQEVDVAACRGRGIPILRRCSGGAAIVTGPGCLMYAVVLSYERYPQLRFVEEAHRFVLQRVGQAVRQLGCDGRERGTSDLAVGDYKVSGNSMRCKRSHLLYHGTLLYAFPAEWIERLLRKPPREPAYRGGRTHLQFVQNLPVDSAALRAALQQAWQAEQRLATWPQQITQQLVAERYSRDSWNFRL